MNRLEDLVRAAQEAQAERAAPAERIRAALPGRARARRRRQRWGATAVVAAAVVAITVPVVVVHRSVAPPVEDTTTCPVLPPADPQVPRSRQSLPAIETLFPGFRPAWLPAGYTEHTRPPVLFPAPKVFVRTRTWTKPAGGAEIDLVTRPVAPDPASELDRRGQPVDINGSTGYYRGSTAGHTSSVDWAVGEPPVVQTVSAAHTDLPEQDLLRVARSVQPDVNAPRATAAIGFELVVCGLPANLSQLLRGNIGPGDTGPWTYYLDVWKGTRSISIYLGTSAFVAVGGEPFRLAGYSARRRESADGKTAYLLLDIGYGRYVTLIGDGFSYDDLARIVTATRFY